MDVVIPARFQVIRDFHCSFEAVLAKMVSRPLKAIEVT